MLGAERSRGGIVLGLIIGIAIGRAEVVEVVAISFLDCRNGLNTSSKCRSPHNIWQTILNARLILQALILSASSS